MGRHAVTAPGGPHRPAGRGSPDVRTRLVLAGAVAATALLATTWAGAGWPVGILTALGAGVVVLLAASVASTLPSPRADESRPGPTDPSTRPRTPSSDPADPPA